MSKCNLTLKGDRFILKEELKTHGLSSWSTAYTGSFECTIPKHTIMIADWDQVKGAQGFGCTPQNYKELEAQLVPASDISAQKYSGYYFNFMKEDVGTKLEQISYRTLETQELNLMIKESQFPIQLRAAIELYQRADKAPALNFLKDQLILKKRPESTDAAMTLGRLKDNSTIELLLSNLGEFNDISIPFALPEFEDKNLEEKLARLAGVNTLRGIHAVIALGLMEKKEAVSHIIDITKQWKRYGDTKFTKGMSINYFKDLWKILGIYSQNKKAINFFFSYLDERSLGAIIKGFVMTDEYPKTLNIFEVWDEVGSKIVKIFGWDNYLDSIEKRHAFTFPLLDKSAEGIRNKVIREILTNQ